MQRLFDAYLFIDWSSSARPTRGKDSIWIAEGVRADGEVAHAEPVNVATRRAAYRHVRERLLRQVAAGRSVLVGFDFPYGFPTGAHEGSFGASGDTAAWHHVWKQMAAWIDDDERNRNNRFEVAESINERMGQAEGPFWGRHHAWPEDRYPRLGRRKPACLRDGPVVEHRLVEEQLARAGAPPESVWHVFGGSKVVGAQTLVGLPHLQALRTDPELAEVSRVWPFETGLVRPVAADEPEGRARVIHAEIWPGAIPFDASLHPVRDAAQMLSYVSWASSQDDQGALGSFFEPLGPMSAPADRRRAELEGWILGFCAG